MTTNAAAQIHERGLGSIVIGRRVSQKRDPDAISPKASTVFAVPSAADGKFLGTIPGPQGLHGTFFGGRDRKTLFGIVFYATWGTPSARNEIIAIPTVAQGFTGRAK